MPRKKVRQTKADSPVAKPASAPRKRKIGNDADPLVDESSAAGSPTKVYGRRAREIAGALSSEFGDRLSCVTCNPEKPRRQSFEISLKKGSDGSILLWTGIKKGPPRKLKFPDPESIIQSIKENL